MTTVVWDGTTLASDSQATMCWGEIVQTPVKKIYPLEGGKYRDHNILGVGVAGSASNVLHVMDWLKAGAPIEGLEGVGGPDTILQGSAVIIVTDGGVYLLDSSNRPMVITDRFALGSGSTYANSALLMGLNAEEAVRHAIKLDAGSGGDIQSLQCGNVELKEASLEHARVTF